VSQITIRNLPEHVEAELRRLAAEKRLSLSRMASLLVLRGMGFEPEGGKRRDVSCVFGRWDPEEYAEFQTNTALFDKIDDELWK
jgi:hypothetical protein